MKRFFKHFIYVFMALALIGCTESEVDDTDLDLDLDDQTNTDDDLSTDDDQTDDQTTEDDSTEGQYGDELVFSTLPTQTGTETTYSPSSRNTPYIPITVYTTTKTDGSLPYIPRTNTRIIPYMTEFEAEYSPTAYANSVNKYGSRLDRQGTATGRYHTEKIDGRWWIVDPDGYLNIQRGLTSINRDCGEDGAWEAKWSSITDWFTSLYADFKSVGFNATGAFCAEHYMDLIAHSSTAENPITINPSMGWVGAFKNAKGLSYPDGDSDTKATLVLHEDWPQWCIDYLPTSDVATYEKDANVLGFFSDNELYFCNSTTHIIDLLLAVDDATNFAYQAAQEFLTRKGITADQLTVDLCDDFAGEVADRYYSGIRAALDYHNYQIMYLGSRLHGRPKQVTQIIEAAAKSCDVISINYYSRWSVEHTGADEGSGALVTDMWEAVDAPFMVTEFYVMGYDGAALSGCDVANSTGAGMTVTNQTDRGSWYQHFTLGLLESTHCVGWHWFKHQDADNGNRGFYDRKFNLWDTLSLYAKLLNYNTYNLIDYFDEH